ncbi:RagB/SusD family nutrient uptake outer membrane protein [Mucilaginibacter celer]|uniref:RagB/SusD family nutrient uptake outer membrane protein n=1 Tax=Mucilaginibacter celer TaxID=2305508 RepID=A0A494VS69_9SPHI|nr:RagB/SusD family nutrient uptake outer membrane protein [Mucilaginibacter celer]AYL94215.1 RagB/SusD family nutrient uptake outer membrane protein [Mucilaginibacter celer]
MKNRYYRQPAFGRKNTPLVPAGSKRLHYGLLLAILMACLGCKKQDDFLDAKTNAALSVPKTLEDYQSLLHNEGVFNAQDPALGQIASDDYYVSSADWASLYTTQEINGYIWAKKVYDAGANILDWSNPYIQVYYANTVLDALAKMKVNATDQAKFNTVRGNALFYRANAFYNLVQTFALPYDPQTSATDPGIPLRLNSDLTVKSTRATVRACYDQVITDLQAAAALLPDKPLYRTEASKAAACGMLARVYLAVTDYRQAYKYADQSLAIHADLVDYNTLKPNDYTISNDFLAEDIYHSALISYSIISVNYKAVTDSVLYASYNDNDLRKSAFFILNKGLPYFRGSYDFKGNLFSGIATDEMYLIRAECSARLGDKNAALTDLNTLMAKRWKTGTFIPFEAGSSADALNIILTERRKELLFRGLRWTDLRRLNKEPGLEVTPVRNIEGTQYNLPPNDKRYAWPIPDNEIQVSGIPQNPR